MNNKTLKIKIPIATLLSLGVAFSLSITSLQNRKIVSAHASVIATDGCKYVSKLPTKIDLNPVNADEIRSYYSSLTSLDESELQGTNLLKNLKPILYEMNYYSYNNIWKIYEITDRDWDNSPASLDKYGEYDSSTNSYAKYAYGSTKTPKNDPLVHALYRDPTVEGGQVRAWGSHTNTGINREHVWCQSRGFSDAGNGATGPAGTDLHHLIVGDGYVNTAIHNNNPYGFVSVVEAAGSSAYNNTSKKGTALHTFSEDESTVVFEPRDEDKGDIARAIFYMAARYNNYSGEGGITNFEPNLVVVNYATSNGDREYSSDTKPVGMGILQDLLVWNKLDPVDEYEIHRNDLIYKNYQGNRNPFVDFPEWADYIWGTATMNSYDPNPTGHANPNSDVLNDADLLPSKSFVTLKTSTSVQVSATTKDSSNINWTVANPSLVSISKTTSASGEKLTITSNEVEGKTTITCSATIDGEPVSKTIHINVSNSVVPVDPNEEDGFKLDKRTLIIIAIVAGGIIVLGIIIYASSNSENKKKIAKNVKKSTKSIVKTLSSSGTKKKTTTSKKK